MTQALVGSPSGGTVTTVGKKYHKNISVAAVEFPMCLRWALSKTEDILQIEISTKY